MSKMYKYGQFCKTPLGRMRIRKSNLVCACTECKISEYCGSTDDLFDFCINNLPGDAYLEKPNVGGKDQQE